MNRMVGLGVAALLIVFGIALMVIDVGGVEPECAAPGDPTSGFVDEDNPDCAITIESYEEIVDAESGLQWDNIAGLVLVLAGLGIGVTTLVRGRASAGPDAPAGPPSAGPPSAG